MKYRVPDRLSYVATEKFLDSLPDEFEIVPDGHVCVKWPPGVTRERLTRAARDLHDIVATCGGELCNPASTEGRNILEALSDIAPERMKRKETRWVGWHEGEIVMRDYRFKDAIMVEIED